MKDLPDPIQKQLKLQIHQAAKAGEYETVVRGERRPNYLISSLVGPADFFEPANFTSKNVVARSGLSLINNILNFGGWIGNSIINLAYVMGSGINWFERKTGIDLTALSISAQSAGPSARVPSGFAYALGRWSAWAQRIFPSTRLRSHIRAMKSPVEGKIVATKGTGRVPQSWADEVAQLANKGSKTAGQTATRLRFLHPESSMSKASFEYWSGQRTKAIINSLKPGGKEAPLIRKGDLIMQGNTRMRVLLERGVDIDLLPFVPY